MQLLEAAALPILTIALIVFFTLWPSTADTFPTLGNLRVTVVSQSVLVIIAMASLLPIIAGAYDFSVGAICGLSAMTVAALASGGTPLWLAIVGGAIVGALIGCFNGYLVTVIKVDSVVVTLGMTIIVAGLVNWRTGGQAIVSGIPKELTAIAKPWLFGLPGAFYISLLMTVITYYLLRHVPYGRYLEAVGTNVSAARLVGLRPGRLTFITFVRSGTIAALPVLV